MTDLELIAWLTLYFTPRLGPKGMAKLLSKASPVQIVAYDQQQLQALGLTQSQVKAIQQPNRTYISQCLEWRQASSLHHIVTLQSGEYPPLLRQISAPPAVLFVQGDLQSIHEPQIALVGSRHASIDGLNNAKYFASALAKQNLVVTSGLALGIDGHAHDGALKAGGKTIAVLGCGLNHLYPARHRQLAHRVVESGALVSEFHPDVAPKASNFPRRNRIISGLSLGVLVVEAAERSGSLITARYAAEQGREVFAIPGSIQMPQARGCNSLIQQGACLVQSKQDVLNEIDTLLRWSNINKPLVQNEPWSEKEPKEQLPFAKLLANVGAEVTPVDILAQRTHIPVQEVMMQLLELELSGHVVAVSGGYILKGRGKL
ncbi:nucleotide-binding protein [Vibrio ichthyoenteri ATCC 700023]|uniref:Nucleotide-binding protein n=1 Tax=Vibrio ichthyoenteri ATCC 700023 TaxID=870968 RepID=F9S619_9VIBR|nr:DNA-processing protein DprA [Vibrio ichthyoenteri]EGU34182.1 nucleotide-binding protein [Vibrio ichthyoenteri ATCC 700023]